MMDKKILASMLIIAVASALVGAGTVSYFSDTETSKGNTFTVAIGQTDLKIENLSGSGYWYDGIGPRWTLSDMKPGYTTSGSVNLKNFGGPGEYVEITCNYTVIEEEPQTESDTNPNTNEHPDHMAQQMIITECTYSIDGYTINCLTGGDNIGGSSNDWKIEDKDSDGKITLYDLKNDPLTNLPPCNTAIATFYMALKFSEDANNDFQGDTLDLTMIFSMIEY